MSFFITGLLVTTPEQAQHKHILVWDYKPTTAQLCLTAIAHFKARSDYRHCTELAKGLQSTQCAVLLQELQQSMFKL